MSYVIASYGITALALGVYALSLYNERRRLRDELSSAPGDESGQQGSGAPIGR